MTQQSDALSTIVFKMVPGGYVYRAPNPYVFGKHDHYLVDAAQRDKLLAALASGWSPRAIAVALIIAMVLMFTPIIALNVYLPGFETTIWTGAAFLFLPMLILAQSLLARRTLKRVQPILDGAERTDQQVTLADIRSAQVATPSFYDAQKRNVKLTALGAAVSLVAAVFMYLDQKPATSFLFSMPVIFFIFNAAVNAILTYNSLLALKLRRNAIATGIPENMPDVQIWPQRALKALLLALLVYVTIAAVFGIRHEFSDQGAGQRAATRGDNKAAIANFTKAIEAAPNNTTALLGRARSALAVGDNLVAIADLTRVIELQPSNADAYRWRGQANRQAGLHDGAIADYTRLLELSPGDAYANYYRGLSHAAMKNHDAAITEFSRAIEIKLTDTYAYVSRGRSLEAKTQYDAAIADYTKAIAINPNYENAYLSRAGLYATMKQNDLAGADYTRYLEFKPADANTYSLRANVFIAKNDPQSAVADYGKAIELQPENYFANFMRGTLHERMGDSTAAIADYTRAIEIQPKSAGAYSRRAGVHVKAGLADRAAADFTKAIELAPADIGVRAIRASFYESQGAAAQAIEDYKALLALPAATPSDRQRQDLARKAIQRLSASTSRVPGAPQ